MMQWSAKLQQAKALHRQGRLRQAQILYEEILRAQSRHVEALHLLGMIAGQTHDFKRAVTLMDKVIEIDPRNAAAYSNRAIALKGLRQFEAALASYNRAIALKSDYAEAYSNRGNVLRELKRFDAALASYNEAIALRGDYAEAYYNRGVVLGELERLSAALDSYNQAALHRSNYAEAYSNRGVILQKLKQLDAALASFDRAIALKPDYVEAHSNRGNVLRELKHYDAALASLATALALKPDYAEAHSNRGAVLQEIEQYDAALASFDRAVGLRADFAEAHFNRAVALRQLKQFDAALAGLDTAISLRSDYAEAHFNRGALLQEIHRYDGALASYDTAFALKPDLKLLFGLRRHVRMSMCDWGDFDSDVAQLAARIERGESASPPFQVLALSECPSLQKRAAEIWVRETYPPDTSLPAIPKGAKREKVSICYFSADYRAHPVSMLIAELIESHDRSRFEVTGFSFGPDTQDEMRKRMQGAFDRFIDVRGKSDREIALLARALEIDIAVDLTGFTGDCRPRIFALRAAPLQISYIGYLGTMGAEYIDYLVADATLVPAADQGYYTEKIIYLPSYQANDSKRCIAPRLFSREELGLPPAAFVFCCFNASYKITPTTFDGWMRILQRVPGSVLYLYAGGERAEGNLRQEAARRGVDAQRVVFGQRLPVPEYLARYRAADLFLDTLPYNAGTTASDALWAGLPVLTCLGRSFAGRVAASLLRAIELPELIATTQEQYEELAVALASDPPRLASIKARLAANRLTTRLFDTPRFTQSIEAAYSHIYERYLADMPTDHVLG